MDLNNKIVYGIERLSDAFKTLLWEEAKTYGISPIQIQILLFVSEHRAELCQVSHLSKEFNVTKPTISDAVRVLNNKGFLRKEHSSADNRSYSLFMTSEGKALVKKVSNYKAPILKAIEELPHSQHEQLYASLSDVIYKLNQQGILEVQRTCYACRFHENKGAASYCNLLQKELNTQDIRLDCKEFESKN